MELATVQHKNCVNRVLETLLSGVPPLLLCMHKPRALILYCCYYVNSSMSHCFHPFYYKSVVFCALESRIKYRICSIISSGLNIGRLQSRADYILSLSQQCFIGQTPVGILLSPEPYQPHSKPPNWGGPRCHSGPKIKSRDHLDPQRKLRSSKLKYEALEISEVISLWKPFERKVLLHYSYTFENKLFTHYNCCWGPLWKQSSLLIHYICCWAPLKARYFTHCSCKREPEASASSLAFP